MEKEDAIKYLENLQQGDFLTVNIPIIADKKIQVTAMYVGKDKEGRYNFIDSGNFILSKEFLEKGNISIDKEYNGDIATDIYAKYKREQERKNKQKKHNRDYR